MEESNGLSKGNVDRPANVVLTSSLLCLDEAVERDSGVLYDLVCSPYG